MRIITVLNPLVKRTMKSIWIILSFLCIVNSAHGMGYNSNTSDKELNIYSARKEALIKPLLDQFSKNTGTKINLITGTGDSLIARLKSEGIYSPADLLLTVDAGRLYRAQRAGLLQPMISKALNKNIPSHLRSKDDQWFGLSIRARVIVYSRERVTQNQLSTYEALSDPKWLKKICVRSSSNIYNQSLVAGMLTSYGIEFTSAWLEGLVKNFARNPSGGDRDQIKAVAAGECDIALVNSYYLAGMLSSEDPVEVAAASNVALFWPDQNQQGTHINISGVGITKSSSNPDLATNLIIFLTSDESQKWYAQVNNEFPLRDGIELNNILKSWGAFKASQVNVSELGRQNVAAIKAMDRAGWK